MKTFVALAAASAFGLVTAAYAQGHPHQQEQEQGHGSMMSGGMHEHMDRMGDMDHGGMMGMAASAKTYSAAGEIVSIKDTQNPPSVTIKHEPVPALKWPAMTMDFKAQSSEALEDLREGDQVAFEFVKGEKGAWVITQLKKKTGN